MQQMPKKQQQKKRKEEQAEMQPYEIIPSRPELWFGLKMRIRRSHGCRNRKMLIDKGFSYREGERSALLYR